jgi:hypothetical protein
VDGLAYCPCQPMNCSCQVRVQSPLTGAIMSCHTVQVGVAVDCLCGGCEAPGMGYLPQC